MAMGEKGIPEVVIYKKWVAGIWRKRDSGGHITECKKIKAMVVQEKPVFCHLTIPLTPCLGEACVLGSENQLFPERHL